MHSNCLSGSCKFLWLSKSSCKTKRNVQLSHLCAFSLWCVLMWCFIVTFLENLQRHTPQLKSLFILWYSSWIVNLDSAIKLEGQILHLNSRSWCVVFMWFSRPILFAKSLSHILQTTLFNFLCILSSCLVLLSFLTKLLSQNSHLYISASVRWHFECDKIVYLVWSFWQILQVINVPLYINLSQIILCLLSTGLLKVPWQFSHLYLVLLLSCFAFLWRFVFLQIYKGFFAIKTFLWLFACVTHHMSF